MTRVGGKDGGGLFEMNGRREQPVRGKVSAGQERSESAMQAARRRHDSEHRGAEETGAAGMVDRGW